MTIGISTNGSQGHVECYLVDPGQQGALLVSHHVSGAIHPNDYRSCALLAQKSPGQVHLSARARSIRSRLGVFRPTLHNKTVSIRAY